MFKSTIAKNAACNSIIEMLDTTGTYSSGRLGLYTADSTLVAKLPLSNPAFLSSVDGTAVARPISDATALITGTVSYFEMQDGSDTMVWGGSVTVPTGTGDLKMNTISITKDTTVSVSSATYIVP